MPPRKGRGRPAQHSSPIQNLDPALQTSQDQDVALHPDTLQQDSINADDIFLDLPALYANADALLKLLARCGDRQGVANALADPGSRLRQRLAHGRARFAQQQALFTTSDSHYINPNHIAESLFADHPEAFEIAQQRDISLHDVIYKINIAAFLHTLCDWHDSSPDQDFVADSLRYNDKMFPISFMASLADGPAPEQMELLQIGTSRVKPETIAVGVSMRTQLAFTEMRHVMHLSPGADPYVILREAFYDNEGIVGPGRTVEQLEQQPLRRWHYGAPLSAAEAARVKEFILAIEQQLPDQSSGSAFESSRSDGEASWMEDINELYPWSGFVLDCATWAQSRATELTTQIQLRGGADELIRVVESLRSNDLDALNNLPRLSQTPASTFASPQQHLTPQRSTLTYGYPSTNYQDFDSQRTPTNAPRSGDRLQASLSAFASKTIASMGDVEQHVQSLLDTQINGEKISFSNTMPTAAQPSRKRKHVYDEEDPEPTPDRASKRFAPAQYGTGQHSSITSSAFPQSNTESASLTVLTQPPAPTGMTALAADLGSQQLARLEAISQSYDSVKRAGKDIAEHRKAELKAEDDRKIQERKRWTMEETAALIAYIEELGTSWAVIQKTDQGRGNVLHSRDQVALKDKARNLKFEYLKANAAVPKNFEGVSLSKSMRDKLAAWNGPVVHAHSDMSGQMHGL